MLVRYISTLSQASAKEDWEENSPTEEEEEYWDNARLRVRSCPATFTCSKSKEEIPEQYMGSVPS